MLSPLGEGADFRLTPATLLAGLLSQSLTFHMPTFHEMDIPINPIQRAQTRERWHCLCLKKARA
jgi:hypothetical protein